METLNGIEEAERHAEGASSDLGCLHLPWLGEAFWLSPGKEAGGKKITRVNDFGPLIPLGVFPVCRARSTALECIQRAYPTAVRGGRRDSLQEEVGLRLPGRRWGR